MFARFLPVFLILGSFNPVTSYGQQPATWLGPLPDEIQESSGLLLAEGRFITHNDSGDQPVLYVLDTANLEIVRRVAVKGVRNTDWEALAEDDEYFYIGDFGNNEGNRRDLRILKISKTDFSKSDTVIPELISFAYADQREFERMPKSDWDAEAMLAGRDSLWIFTKQWKSFGTVVYALPKVPGTYIADPVVSFNTRGLITDAGPVPGEEAFLLLGYTPQLQPFVLKVPAANPAEGFLRETLKSLLSIGFAQSEGMALSSEGSLFVSSESFSNRLVTLPAGIYKLNLETELEQAGRKNQEERP
ncbi:MAG: hypothetical protein P8X60_07950 [Robiginitalea sp.]